MRTIQCQAIMINNEQYQDIDFTIPLVCESSGYDYTDDCMEILEEFKTELFEKYFGDNIWLVIDVTIDFKYSYNYGYYDYDIEMESKCDIIIAVDENYQDLLKKDIKCFNKDSLIDINWEEIRKKENN